MSSAAVKSVSSVAVNRSTEQHSCEACEQRSCEHSRGLEQCSCEQVQ